MLFVMEHLKDERGEQDPSGSVVVDKVDDQGGCRIKLVDDQGRCRTKLVDEQEGCRTKLAIISCKNKQFHFQILVSFVWQMCKMLYYFWCANFLPIAMTDFVLELETNN